MKTKKIIALLLALLMAMTCFIACSGADETEASENETETDATEEDTRDLDEYGRENVADDIPLDRNYSNRNDNIITFFTRNDLHELSVEIDSDTIVNDTLGDAVFRRNITIEDRLGVTITQISQLGNWGPHTTWLQTLRNAVSTKTGEYDAAAVYASQGAALAVEGMYYNINNIEEIHLDKPWWNSSIMKDLELFDTLFFLGGDLAITQVTNAGVLFYNKEIFKEYYPEEDLYALVDNYEWTVDKLYELTSPVWVDENSSGVVDDGDTVGYLGWSAVRAHSYMDLWIAALGVTITEKNSDGIPELSIYNSRTIDVTEKLRRLIYDNPGSLSGTANTSATGFEKGNVMFATAVLGTGELLRDMEAAYGALPLPMYNKEQAHYATYPQNGCSLIVVLSTLTADRREMVGSTLELMAAESYRQVTPAYYSVVLKSKYSADAEDARMYDIILDGIRIDFGFVYSTTMLGTPTNLFRSIDQDFVQLYESKEETYLTKLELLIDTLDELSLKMELEE